MRLTLIIFGLLTAVAGLLPFLSGMGFMPSFLANVPTSGPVYSGIVAVIGIVELVYGMRAGERIT